MRYKYKQWPLPDGTSDWSAILNVRISNLAKHSPPSVRFEAIIDSGATDCLFHADIGRAVGLRIESGDVAETMGVTGAQLKIHYHPIGLHVADHILKIQAGFSDQLPVLGLLGRRGFFEAFRVTFDSSLDPPGFELEKINRA